MGNKVAIGSIPEKICYVYSDEKEVAVGCVWDISYYDNEEHKTVREKVLPAFPTDNDENMLRRAHEWAEQAGYLQKKKSTHADVVDNLPIKNVRVLSLEHRGQGGRAYKVVIGKYYVDLREDVLMDTLLQTGIDPGGILRGEYVWARTHSHMKLVRVGSELHRLIVEFQSKKDIQPIEKNNLEIGGVYRTRKKDKSIFIGYVNTTTLRESKIVFSKGKAIYDSKVPVFSFKKTPIKKAMLFYEVVDCESMNDNVKSMSTADNHYRFKIKKTHNFIEKTERVKIPEGVVVSLRNTAIKAIKENILKYAGRSSHSGPFTRMSEHQLQSSIAYASEFLNIYESGTTPIEVFDVKKYLLFS
jgi:hypothetical protein